jgi:hypothetical protein
MPHSFKPTPEQHAVVDAVLGGGDLKIKAYAGAGKTSTLRLVADRLAGRRGSYLTFNSAKPVATIEASCRARDSASERIAHTAPVVKWRPLIARHRAASRRASSGPRSPHEEYCVAPNPGLASRVRPPALARRRVSGDVEPRQGPLPLRSTVADREDADFDSMA